MFVFGGRSRARMNGLHPNLVAVADRALSYGVVDLTVPQYGGVRTLEDQRVLVDRGASQTLNSLHRIQSTGYAHAIDLLPLPVNWNDLEAFNMMGTLMFRAAMELGVAIEWGGHWKSFKDYPHFQLPRGYKG